MAHNLRAALLSLGHEVTIFDHTRWLFRTSNPSLLNRALDRICARWVSGKINEAYREAIDATRWDLVIVLKGLHLTPRSIQHTLDRASLVVNWNPDDFFNPLNTSKELLASFHLYHHIFTPRKHLIAEYSRRGAQEATHLGCYYLPEFQYPESLPANNPNQGFPDVIFLGTWSARREAILSALTGIDLRVHGGCWYKAGFAFKNRAHPGAPIFLEAMRKMIQNSKININILTTENRDAINMRTFEIPACAGFQLSERSDDILELFDEGKEIACFASPEELRDKCRYYLANDAERRRISQNGHARLLAGNNTMLDRAKEILSALTLD